MSGFMIFTLVLAVLAVVFAFQAIKVVPQQSAWIVERLGKFHAVLSPGLNVVIPFIDRVAYKHSLKEIPLDTPSQVCITKDNTQLSVDGVLFFQVTDPTRASYGTSNYVIAITQLAQTTLRSVIGKMELDKTFEERDLINHSVVSAIDEAALNWGVKVLRYEIKDLTPPAVILQAMQQQITAEREKRAVVAASEGRKQEQINLATGAREAAIAESEGEKQAAINKAEGEAAATLAIAKATAEADKSLQHTQDELNELIAQKQAELDTALKAKITESEAEIRLSKEQALKEVSRISENIALDIVNKLGLKDITAADIKTAIKKTGEH